MRRKCKRDRIEIEGTLMIVFRRCFIFRSGRILDGLIGLLMLQNWYG